MTISSLSRLKPYWQSSRTYNKYILYISIYLCIIYEYYFLSLFIYLWMLNNGTLVNTFNDQTGLTESSELYSSIPFDEFLQNEEDIWYEIYLEYVIEGMPLLYDDYEHNDLMTEFEWFHDLNYKKELLNIIKLK